MAQPQKRARLAEVTADTHQEGATDQNQSTEGGHLAPIGQALVQPKAIPQAKVLDCP